MVVVLDTMLLDVLKRVADEDVSGETDAVDDRIPAVNKVTVETPIRLRVKDGTIELNLVDDAVLKKHELRFS